MNKVTIYSTPSCHFCHMAKDFFKEKNVDFQDFDVASDMDKRKEILIGIDTKTNHIYNLIEVGKNGTKTTLTVSSFKFNQALAKNQFTFVKAKYPNYYINKAD